MTRVLNYLLLEKDPPRRLQKISNAWDATSSTWNMYICVWAIRGAFRSAAKSTLWHIPSRRATCWKEWKTTADILTCTGKHHQDHNTGNQLNDWNSAKWIKWWICLSSFQKVIWTVFLWNRRAFHLCLSLRKQSWKAYQSIYAFILNSGKLFSPFIF